MQRNHGPSPEEKFGASVAEARKARNLSQREFADRLSTLGMQVDASAVSRIESGSRSVRLTEAMTIAEALNVDLSLLVRDARTPSQVLTTWLHNVSYEYRLLSEELLQLAVSLDQNYSYLLSHPELAKTLPAFNGAIETPDDYFDWEIERIKNEVDKWQVVTQEVSIEGAARVIKALTLQALDTRDDGVNSEEA